jgi:1-acyl-sn-glycerol-3-phosphate acyltransferase
MDPREVARAARRSIQVARERLSMGEALLVFAEGSRSRSGEMQPLLPGVARYLDAPGTLVVPIGLAGTEQLFPIDGESLTPVPITVSIGVPAEARVLIERSRGNRRVIMDCVGFAIGDLLAPEYRGVYGRHDGGRQEARRLADELFSRY